MLFILRVNTFTNIYSTSLDQQVVCPSWPTWRMLLTASTLQV